MSVEGEQKVKMLWEVNEVAGECRWQMRWVALQIMKLVLCEMELKVWLTCRVCKHSAPKGRQSKRKRQADTSRERQGGKERHEGYKAYGIISPQQRQWKSTIVCVQLYICVCVCLCVSVFVAINTISVSFRSEQLFSKWANRQTASSAALQQ